MSCHDRQRYIVLLLWGWRGADGNSQKLQKMYPYFPIKEFHTKAIGNRNQQWKVLKNNCVNASATNTVWEFGMVI